MLPSCFQWVTHGNKVTWLAWYINNMWEFFFYSNREEIRIDSANDTEFIFLLTHATGFYIKQKELTYDVGTKLCQ